MMKGKVDYFLFQPTIWRWNELYWRVYFRYHTKILHVYIMFTNKSQTFIFLFILLLSPVFTNSINKHEIRSCTEQKFVEKKVKNKDKSNFSQVRRVSKKKL